MRNDRKQNMHPTRVYIEQNMKNLTRQLGNADGRERQRRVPKGKERREETGHWRANDDEKMYKEKKKQRRKTRKKNDDARTNSAKYFYGVCHRSSVTCHTRAGYSSSSTEWPRTFHVTHSFHKIHSLTITLCQSLSFIRMLPVRCCTTNNDWYFFSQNLFVVSSC